MNRLSFGRTVLPLSRYPDTGPQKLRIRKINVRQDSQFAASNRDPLNQNQQSKHGGSADSYVELTQATLTVRFSNAYGDRFSNTLQLLI